MTIDSIWVESHVGRLSSESEPSLSNSSLAQFINYNILSANGKLKPGRQEVAALPQRIAESLRLSGA